MAAATVTDDKILDVIVEYIKSHGYPPTVREIGEAAGLKSSSTVHAHLTRMLKKGMIETDADTASRAIRVPGYKFVQEDAPPAAGV